MSPNIRSKDPMGLILAAARVDPHLMRAAYDLDQDRRLAAKVIADLNSELEMLRYSVGDMANIIAAAINWRNGHAYKATADHPTSKWLAELLDAWDYDAIVRDEAGYVLDGHGNPLEPCIPRCAGCTACKEGT